MSPEVLRPSETIMYVRECGRVDALNRRPPAAPYYYLIFSRKRRPISLNFVSLCSASPAASLCPSGKTVSSVFISLSTKEDL